MGKTILVTGAAGFIASHLARHLLERGDRVIGLDNFCDYYSPEQKRRNAAGLSCFGDAFQLIEGDFRNRALLEDIFSNNSFQAVAHLGAMAGVRASVADPWLYYDVNLTGTLNLLEAARLHGQPNFVFASTSSAYGRTDRIPFEEGDPADRPLAPYPASKRSAELLGHSYHHMHGTDFTALRFFTVYGPAGRPDMMAYLVLDSMRTGREIPLYNSGDMLRDWTYVGDITAGIAAALDRRLGYEVINLGRGEPVSLRDFISSLERLSGRPANLREAPMMAADVPITFARIDKARRLLGYQPRTSVEEGARKFYDWFVDTIGEIA